MKFGRYLRENVHPPWREHYIDYSMLKKVVYRTQCVQEADMGLIDRAVLQQTLDEDVAEFMRHLDEEIERVGDFYAHTAADLRAKLAQVNAEQQAVGASEEMVKSLREIGRTAVLLVQFLELNLTGLRKILKKHEKRIVGRQVAEGYLRTRRAKESALQRLHNHSELDEIYDSVRHAINVANTDLQMKALLTQDPDGARPSGELRPVHPRTPVARYSGVDSRVSNPSVTSSHAADGHATPIYVHEPIIREMRERLRALNNASRFVSTLVVALAEESGITSAEGQGMEKSGSMLALWVNLLSTFIFMINYYIVLPTSGAYCAALGASSSFSGVAVGILPLSACMAAVCYSYATQFSYKVPLVMSSLLCLAGNVTYALALPSKSLSMLLVGRVLVGMGGARVVNRRYIADHVELDYRTEASAAFVAFTALGMAVGPGIASVVSLLPSFEVSGLPINALTSPGWFMVLLWWPFAATVVLFFEDPPEKHGPGSSVPPDAQDSKASKADTTMPLLHDAEERGEAVASPDGAKSAPRTPTTPSASSTLRRTPSRFGDAMSVPLLTIEEPLRSTGPQLATVAALLWLYLADKLVAEAFLTSAPIVTRSLFGWEESAVGVFLCVVCALVLPAAQVSRVAFSKVPHNLRERRIINVMMVLVLAGGAGLLCYQPPFDSTDVIVYVAGASVFFLANNLLEAATMSLLSKKMPKTWAAGVLNSGFLTTLTGLGGRVLGNALVSALGSLAGPRTLEDALMAPLLIIWIFTGVLVFSIHSRLTA